MSIHAHLSEEAQARLNAQRRNSTISSIIIAILVIVLISLVLGIFLLPNIIKETPTIVTYAASLNEETEQQSKKVNTQIQRKPSAPSNSMTKVIASNSVSPTAIPVPEIDVVTPSADFGDGEDFGGGWGDGSVSGTGGGGATFFNQSVKGDRIAYVIDYSASMRGKREELMRDELKKSVSGLQSGMKYQMIFFAGPAWVAGDELKFSDGDEAGKESNEAEVKTTEGKKYKLEKKGRWQVPSNYKAEWMDASEDNLRASRKIIKDHGLVYGTEWSKPLEMAMDMKPAPQIIFFMTDGTGGTVNKVKELATMAKRKKIVINSVAMMMPSAADAMAALAHGTGGVFTIIDEKGRAKEVKPEEK